MILSKEAKEYKKDCDLIMSAGRFNMTSRTVQLTLGVHRPRKSGDLDNVLKLGIDAIVGTIIADDEQVVEIHARRFEDKTNPRVEITVEEIGE